MLERLAELFDEDAPTRNLPTRRGPKLRASA